MSSVTTLAQWLSVATQAEQAIPTSLNEIATLLTMWGVSLFSFTAWLLPVQPGWRPKVMKCHTSCVDLHVDYTKLICSLSVGLGRGDHRYGSCG